MLAVVMMVVAVAENVVPAHAGPNIPTLLSPLQAEGQEVPVYDETQNPWKHTSNMDEMSNTDLMGRIKNMYGGQGHQGSDVDLEAQKRYGDELAALADEVNAESDKIAANSKQQDANNDGIKQEGHDLITVHHNQRGEESLYNAAASMSNQIWRSEHMWQTALVQANKVENFVGAADTDVINVLGDGAQALDAAKDELASLQQEAMAKVDDLDENCAQKILDWSNQGTTQVNDQTRSLVMVFERLERLQKVFDKSHELVVTLLQELSAQMKTVTGLSTVDESGGSSLLQEQDKQKQTSLIEMQSRIKAALDMPVKKVKDTNHSVHDTGFWDKVKVLVEAFELHTGEALEPIEFIMKRFRDA